MRWICCVLTIVCLCLPTVEASPVTVPAPLTVALARPVVAALLTPDEVIALMNKGELDEAEAAARKAAQAHPESARSRLLLARVLARQGRLEEARQSLAEAKALPQWKKEDLGVPFKSPREIEIVMQSDPTRARHLVADVLLAQGDDPKAYYLLSLAAAMQRDWPTSESALATAKRLAPDLNFAHPDTLASLERAIAQRTPPEPPSTSQAPPKSFWQKLGDMAWTGLGFLVALGFGFYALVTVLHAMTQKFDNLKETPALWRQYKEKLKAEIDSLAAEPPDSAKARYRTRLLSLNKQLDRLKWRVKWGKLTPNLFRFNYNRVYEAMQDDQKYAAYQAKMAKRGYKSRGGNDDFLIFLLDSTPRRSGGSNSDIGTSFRSESDSSSWSSGDTSSSTDNSGGSNW